MTEIDPQSAEKDLGEVYVHISYIRKDISKLDKRFTALENKIDRLAAGFVTKKELTDAIDARKIDQEKIIKDICAVDNRVKRLERIFEGITGKIAGIAITFLVLLILAQWGLDKYFRG